MMKKTWTYVGGGAIKSENGQAAVCPDFLEVVYDSSSPSIGETVAVYADMTEALREGWNRDDDPVILLVTNDDVEDVDWVGSMALRLEDQHPKATAFGGGPETHRLLGINHTTRCLYLLPLDGEAKNADLM